MNMDVSARRIYTEQKVKLVLLKKKGKKIVFSTEKIILFSGLIGQRKTKLLYLLGT